MFKEISGFEVHEDSFIWRYLDFAKFISLLHKQKLFFSKAMNFKDRFEGATTEANINCRMSEIPDIPQDIYESSLEHIEFMKTHIYANCWQTKETEVNLMWSEYVKDKTGVAIKSNYKNLKESLANNSNIDIFGGSVKYIDYEVEKFNELHSFLYYLHKRKYFADENELRIMILLLPHRINLIPLDDITKHGIFLSVNLEVLIDKIVISPTAELWIKELVESMLHDLNLNKKVELSELNKLPSSD